jgi:hypothetical protein
MISSDYLAVNSDRMKWLTAFFNHSTCIGTFLNELKKLDYLTDITRCKYQTSAI